MEQHLQPARSRRSGLVPQGGSVSLVILAMNVVVWVALFVSGRFMSPWFGWLSLDATQRCFVPGDGYYIDVARPVCEAGGGVWLAGVADGAWWKLLTSAFTHLEPMHIGFNMIALFVLGPPLERLLGHVRFLAIYVFSALAGSVVVYVLSDPNSATIGASGAIFGLMGAVLVVTLRYRGNYQQILIWLALNAGFTIMMGASVSWQGHLGGFLGGLASGALLGHVPAPSWPPPTTPQRPSPVPWLALAAATVGLIIVVVWRTLQLSP